MGDKGRLGVLQDELRSMEGRRFNEEEKVDGIVMMHNGR